MIDVPAHVENEDAYIAAAYSRIAANARKTTLRRCAEDAEFARIINMVEDRGMNAPETTFFGSLFKSLSTYGKLSDRQVEAVAKIIARADERKAELRQRDAGSVHVGTVGKRETFTLTLTGTYETTGMYGVSYTHFMRDEAGNVIIYRGTKLLPMEKGETAQIAASVKSHSEREGIKQTYITRAKRV